MSELVRKLVESDDIEEVRQLRQQLNALIRDRMEEVRKKATGLRKQEKPGNPKKGSS